MQGYQKMGKAGRASIVELRPDDFKKYGRGIRHLPGICSKSIYILRSRAVLKGEKKVCSFVKRPCVAHMFNRGCWRLAVDGWRLAVGGSWWLAIGGWWGFVVGGWRWVVVGSSWRLVAVGGWWSLGAVLKGGP